MFCKKCGAQIPDDSVFCTCCGVNLSQASTPNVANTVQEPKQSQTNIIPDYNPSEMASYILSKGITGFIFALTGVLSFLGIIFCAKAKHQANKYEEFKCESSARVSVGRKFASIGLVFAIIFTAIFVMAIISLILESL